MLMGRRRPRDRTAQVPSEAQSPPPYDLDAAMEAERRSAALLGWTAAVIGVIGLVALFAFGILDLAELSGGSRSR